MINGYRLDRAVPSPSYHKSQPILPKRKFREELSAQYEARVNGFMLAMLQSPQVVNNPAPAKGSSFKGPARLILNGFASEKDRIEAQIAKNQLFDLEPILTKHSFREENRSKDINARMRFSPKDSLDRLREVAKYPNFVHAKQLPSECKPQAIRSVSPDRGGERGSRFSSPDRGKGSPVREIYPSLHKKTHFKAVFTSLYRGGGVGARSSERGQWAKEAVLKQGNFSKDEAPSVALAVLETCKVKRKAASPFLRCGEGRLSGNPDTTIGELYSRLGNNSHSFTPALIRSGRII